MPWCPICNGYMYAGDNHICAPQWLVWEPGTGETVHDASAIYEVDAEAAAVLWAERDDANSADYSIVQGTPTVVVVLAATDRAREVGGRRAKLFRVEGHAEPVYEAWKPDANDIGDLQRAKRRVRN